MTDDTKKVDKAKADNFKRMSWKETTIVAFAKRDKYVVAWYCTNAAGLSDSKSTTIKNLSTSCNAPSRITAANTYNKCYNERAFKRHQELRQ